MSAAPTAIVVQTFIADEKMASKRSRSNGCSSSPSPSLFSRSFVFVQVMLHINWQNWLAVIHQHERRVLCRRMSTNAMRKKDPLDNLWPYFKIIFQNLYQRVLYCSVLTFCQSFRLRVIISKLGSHL